MNVLALCSGVGGGIELGLKLAEPTARTVCYVEREAYPLAVTLTRIREGYLDDAPIWSDVKSFDGTPWREKVDCITGGYPCQPFSVSGRRKEADDPRHLWPDIRRIIAEVQPRFCFFENVAGHLQLGFESVWGDLRGLGYTVEAGLFTAAEVGAPHKRQRLFFLAHAGSSSGNRGGKSQQFQGKVQRRSDTLAHADGSRRWQKGYDQQPTSGIDRSSVRLLWPPYPDDSAGWAEALHIEPSLKPAIRRVADGLPHRVDRLAALGNSVVPAVAATAWRQLRKEAIGDTL